MEGTFMQRVGFNGDLREVSEIICKEFNLGGFVNCGIIPIGYEDLNFFIDAENGKFFVKIFATFRTDEDCIRNVNVLEKIVKAGVSFPKIYPSKQGYLNVQNVKGTKLRICVVDFVEGGDFFTSKAIIGKNDIKFIASQAALIDTIKFSPPKIENRSSIVNFIREFNDKSKYLDKEDFELIQPLYVPFKKLNIEKMPNCFVHGDIIRTNVIKDKDNKIWILDLSVANYSLRIQELALLGCDILFNRDNKEESEENVKYALKEYMKKIKLTKKEINALPLCIKVAHAMHVICANYEKKVNNNNSNENNYFLNLGKAGLRQIN